jgi:hypothetical protein
MELGKWSKRDKTLSPPLVKLVSGTEQLLTSMKQRDKQRTHHFLKD